MVFQDINNLDRDKGEFFGEIMYAFGKEDEQFSEPFIFLLDISEELIKLLLIHLCVFGDVIGVKWRVGWDFHSQFLKLFEQSIVDFFDLLFLHC